MNEHMYVTTAGAVLLVSWILLIILMRRSERYAA